MNDRTETIIMVVIIVLLLVALFVVEHYAIIDQVSRGY
jgi:hypothetical protein